MKTTYWIVVLLVAAFASAIAGYRLAHRDLPDAAAAQQLRQPLYWHDPMKPEVKFDKPGKSPFMDMALVPVYADSAADPGGIAVGANMRQSLGIRLGRVDKATLARHIVAVGTVAYDEHQTALVQARAGGFVRRLQVRAVQDRVRQGQALADLTVPAWIEAEGEYLALLKSESAANDALLEAARSRLLLLGVPDAAMLAL